MSGQYHAPAVLLLSKDPCNRVDLRAGLDVLEKTELSFASRDCQLGEPREQLSCYINWTTKANDRHVARQM